MMENCSKKTNFFKEVLKSVKDLDKYEDFALELPKKAFKYLFKLILLFSLIICILYTYQIVKNMNDIYINLKNKLPDFSYNDGILNVDSKEPIIIEDYEDIWGKVIIDVNGVIEEYEKEKISSILLLKDRCILLNGGKSQIIYNYEEIAQQNDITNFTKQDIINYVEDTNAIYIYSSVYLILFVFLFITYFITIFIDILLLSVLAYFVSRISRIKIKFAPSFAIAVHSITLPIILNLIYIIVNLFTGFKINYFQLMYYTISYIYVIMAVLMIKTDFIQRQMELIKIEQEKEKIREEMKQKEEEKKEEEKKEEEQNKEKQNKEKEDDNSNQKEKEEEKKNNKPKGKDVPEANAPACSELEKEAKEQG